MQVAPEHALRGGAAHGHDALGAPARPPQVQAGQHQQDGPSGGDLDGAPGDAAEILQAVQLADGPGHAAAIGQRAAHRAFPGVHIDQQPPLCGGDADFRRAPGRGRAGVLHEAAGVRVQGGGDQLAAGLQWLGAGAGKAQLPVEDIVDRVLEHKQPAGDRQPDEEGQDQQTGVEVPAPDCAVDVGVDPWACRGVGRGWGGRCHGRCKEGGGGRRRSQGGHNLCWTRAPARGSPVLVDGPGGTGVAPWSDLEERGRRPHGGRPAPARLRPCGNGPAAGS